MLEISLNGQAMQVPMAEILSFARRWEADYAALQRTPPRSTSLPVFPYPLMDTNVNDPDCIDVEWGIP